MKYFPKTFLLALACVGLLATSPGAAQESVYYRNFVEYADGTTARETAPQAAFTAFLNGDQSRILIENAPRWDDGGDPNIDGKGTFGVELANFPGLAVGDTVTVRYTSLARGERGTLTEVVPEIPWSRFPQTLTLAPMSFPAPPRDVALEVADTGERVVTWTAEEGLTYTVYRRTVQDLVPNGASRRLYERVAEGVTEGTFTDTVPDPEQAYGYVVYAVDGEGAVSAHSQEAIRAEPIHGLAATAGATNATLTWAPFTPAIGTLGGYTIYRRAEGEDAFRLIAYAGSDTAYTDTRLDPGATYVYQVRGRTVDQQEAGISNEAAVTTGTNAGGYYTYASLKTAVLVYHDTNLGQIPTSALEAIRRELELARLFYWRNSKMKLNLEFDYYPIEDYRQISGEFDLHLVAQELADRGVMNTQYDLIYRVWPAQNGYWSIGATEGIPLPGPRTRGTGFSQTQWPCGTGVVYPGHEPGLSYCNTWVFVHEAQHAIDDIYRANGHPEMAHGDQPWLFDVPAGEHFDFQARMFRTFEAYESLQSNWGDLYEAGDADADGFPDADPRVPLDEARFGSSPARADTDDDGLDDRAEALDGFYSGSDPTDPDTDGDGLLDGEDPYPRYPVRPVVDRFTPQIDGVLEAGWPLVNDSVSYTQQGYAPELYLGYGADSLYLALRLPHIGVPEIWFDFGADGFWHGRGNTMMRLNISDGTLATLRTRDASPEARAFSESGAGLWDDEGGYEQHFGSRVFRQSQVNLAVRLDWPVVVVEMAIPKREAAGLTLQPGDSLGLYVNYTKVNNQPSQWATTFDQYSFLTFTLADPDAGTGNEPVPSLEEGVELLANYPNPFNPATTLRYRLGEPDYVVLRVFDALGREVRTLVDAPQPAGTYEVRFEAHGLSGGVYFYRLETGGRTQTRSMLLLK